MDLAVVARELYGLPPKDFVTTRTARARSAAASDKSLASVIRALPKPSVGAFVVNQLVRADPHAVEELIELGASLRQAQGGLDAAELRRLDQQRRQLTRAVAADGVAMAVEMGQPVSPAASDQVDQTLHAAMADPDAADAVRSGRLSRALTATGFGRVDVTDAVAAPAALASVTSLTARRSAFARAAAERELLGARAELLAAEREADEAAAAARAAERELQEAEDQRTGLKSEVRRLRVMLERAEGERQASKTRVSAARRETRAADSREDAALRAVGSARETVDQLTTARKPADD